MAGSTHRFKSIDEIPGPPGTPEKGNADDIARAYPSALSRICPGINAANLV